MKRVSFFIFAILFLAIQSQAQVIEPPQLNISVYGELVSITWSELAEAEAYRLYYAPYPDAEVIESLVLGLNPSLFGILPVQSVFYVAVATLVGGKESAISNIETFSIEQTAFNPEIEAIVEGDWYRPGLEPDNVDGYVNASGFDLDADAQLAFNRFIANEAHARGLSVGLKNDLDQIPELVDYFDFMVNEQCHEFDECETLQPFIDAGKPVFNAEYADIFVNDINQRNSMCEESNGRGFDTLVLPLELDDSFRFSCQ